MLFIYICVYMFKFKKSNKEKKYTHIERVTVSTMTSGVFGVFFEAKTGGHSKIFLPCPIRVHRVHFIRKKIIINRLLNSFIFN